MRRQVLAAALVFVFGVLPSAQTPPPTQPLLQAADITYVGPVSVPVSDGTCKDDTTGCLTYGGYALGWGPVIDGQRVVYIGGHDWKDQLCQIAVPAAEGAATVAGKCVTIPTLRQVDPDGAGNGMVLGGSLLFNGRLFVSAFSYYPGNGDTAVATHFMASNGDSSGLTGKPIRVGKIPAAAVAGYMGTIPQDWQTLAGGPALTGNCCTSIIQRSSCGPSVGVWNPDLAGKQSPVPFTPLVFYPVGPSNDPDRFCLAPYNGSHPSNLFTGSTTIGGVLWPSGYRTVAFIGRNGIGDRCYGVGTNNKALHKTKTSDGTTLWCYDPAMLDTKGDHAWPYVDQVWAYDALELLKVKNGKLRTWEVKPYAVWTLAGIPNPNQGATLRSAAYDDASRLLVVTEAYNEAQYNSPPKVHIFKVAAPSTAPAPSSDRAAG